MRATPVNPFRSVSLKLLRRHAAAWAVVLLVAVLLGGLSALQYRWLGDLSDFEQRRMRGNLETWTERFEDDLEDELNVLYRSFEIGRRHSDVLADDLVARFEEWTHDATFPELVEAIYWIDADPDAAAPPPLRVLDRAAGRLVESEWPEEMMPVRAAIEAAQSSRARYGGRSWRRRQKPLHEDVPAVVIYQDETRPRGWTVVKLDSEALLNGFIPDRVQENFAGPDGLDFNVWIVDRDDPSRVVWASHPQVPPPAPSDADASTPLFELSWSLPDSLDDISEDAWRLIVEHRAGSLEAAVGAVRRRNLLLAFGIMLLLGVSVVVLSVASQRAQALAEQRMEFVAAVSHELRTPIAGIRSLSSNLADGVVEESSQTRRYGRAIHRQSQRLADMVENVLRFASDRGGRGYTMQTLDTAAFVREAIEVVVTSTGGEARIDLDAAEALPPVRGDAAALKSAVGNLLSNALKFGPAGGRVDVTVRSVSTNGARVVRIAVCDHGPGIPAAELHKVFEPFYRGRHARQRQVEGCGLGLSLVKHIIEAHGGRIELESEANRGSRFTLVLPAAAASLVTGDDGPAAADDGGRPGAADSGSAAADDGGQTGAGDGAQAAADDGRQASAGDGERAGSR